MQRYLNTTRVALYGGPHPIIQLISCLSTSMYTIDNACLKLRSIKIKSHPSGKAFESLSGSMWFFFFQITQQMHRSTSSFMSLLNRAWATGLMAEFKNQQRQFEFFIITWLFFFHYVYKTTSQRACRKNKKQAYNNGHHFHSRLLLVFEKTKIKAELFR